MKKSYHQTLLLAATAAALVLVPAATYATHSWGNYHWQRTSSQVTVTIVNSTQSSWDGYVNQAVSDWSDSSRIEMVQENGSTNKRTRRRCSAPSGKVRICNDTYGNTGWLGIAGISIDGAGHITSGYTKLNDTYFNTGYYNTFSWKQSVTCQELGHNIGLDHQDEDFNNQSLFSCMDYQDPPYEYPNAHDYQQLETIYNHSHSAAVVNKSATNEAAEFVGSNNAKDWGISLGRKGNRETFVRMDKDGKTRHLTKVTWVEGFGHHE